MVGSPVFVFFTGGRSSVLVLEDELDLDLFGGEWTFNCAGGLDSIFDMVVMC